MAWTAADIASLETAIASGELRVQYQDKVVTYRNIGELERARTQIQRALNNPAPKARQKRMVTKSGW